MGEWGIALIAAGSALAGSLVTGWFTRSAGSRQAAAARHAGDRQADALLDTVRMSLAEQRAVRVLDQRRQTYARFMDAAETVHVSRTTGEGHPDDRPALQRAYGAVLLEGPDETARAAGDLLARVRGSARTPDEVERARRAFIDAARHALAPDDDPGDGPDDRPGTA